MPATRISRRSFLAAGGVLVVGFGLDGLKGAPAQTVPGADRFLGKPLAPDVVDSYLAVHADGSVTIFVGKVDIGTGGRIAMRQIVGEELDIPLQRIAMIEGDTALTPNQGATAGSYGIASAAGGSGSGSSSASGSNGGAIQAASTTPSAPNAQRPWGGQRSDETLLTDGAASKVKEAALAKVPGATIVRVETDADGHAAYEAHIVKSDGTPATVYVNKQFEVVGTESGR